VLVAPRLIPGGRIGLVAPSGPPPPAQLESCEAHLESLGYRPLRGAHLLDRRGYLAGTDADRAADVMAAFADPCIDAVFCARGGYGTGRIVDRLEYQVIRAHPKPLVGFSDSTGLQLALLAQTGLISFTGVLAAADLPPATSEYLSEESLWRLLTNPQPVGPVPVHGVRVLRPGHASGPLIGGCLALICSLVGTPYLPDMDGAVLLVEDVGEYPYRLDRMFNQLRLAGILSRISGLVLGGFRDCFAEAEAPRSLSLEEMVLDMLEGTDIPVLQGLQYGHHSPRLVLPLGLPCELATDPVSLSLTAAAVC
jgi:muramoyltetrapeptide carboxypeptidase